MRTNRYLLFVFILIAGCKIKNETKLTLHLRGGAGRQYVIRNIGFNDDEGSLLDSGLIKSNHDSLVFSIPYPDNRLYKISFEGDPAGVTFITDTDAMDVFYDYFTGKYYFHHSPASSKLKEFNDEQVSLVAEATKIDRQVDSIKQTHGNQQQADLLTGRMNAVYKERYNRILHFADTVRNPALFMVIYGLVDFGNDFDGQKKFITKAAARFPDSRDVQKLAANTLEYISIFEEEFQVGDSLPELVLPNQYGQPVSTYSIKGKYILLDFWSTWSKTSREFSAAKKEAKKMIDSSRFDMISVAIDGEKDTWHRVIDFEGYTWPQLIDEKMWRGEAVKKLKFDSIPFNFLMDPQRRVVAKAIPADSLLPVLKKYIR